MDRTDPVVPMCIGCIKRPYELECYVSMTGSNDPVICDRYVRYEEGTYNPINGHFLCDSCYIAAGMPTSPTGWVCP